MGCNCDNKFDDDFGWRTISVKTTTARKTYECVDCETPIAKGDQVITTVYIDGFSDNLKRYRTHVLCPDSRMLLLEEAAELILRSPTPDNDAWIERYQALLQIEKNGKV